MKAAAEPVVNRVYLLSRPALQHFLTLSTRCPDTAADLVQELYLRLPYLTPVPETEAAIKSWLFKVASNMAIDHFRKEKRHLKLLNEKLPVIDEIESVPTPETVADHDGQLQGIQAVLATLPAVCTEILYLSRAEGLTHQAIAERLGISKSWVEKQLARTLNHLRQSISDD